MIPQANFQGPAPYTVQAFCTGMGWTDTNRSADTMPEAEHQMRELLADDAAWMNGSRHARIARRRESRIPATYTERTQDIPTNTNHGEIAPC